MNSFYQRPWFTPAAAASNNNFLGLIYAAASLELSFFRPMMMFSLQLVALILLGIWASEVVLALSPSKQKLLFSASTAKTKASLASAEKDSINEEYVNPLTKLLGLFVPKERANALDGINWKVVKRRKTSLKTLAVDLERALSQKEWFVNGNVDPTFFSDEFSFQDPDVKIKGIESYARGVNKIFSQKDSRAEIVAVRVNETIANTLTVTWRLSGGVNIGPGLNIKPYVVYTDFKVSTTDGLVVFQEDRFSIPGYDILLSALFPFLVGSFLSPPAPSVEVLKSEFLKKEKRRSR